MAYIEYPPYYFTASDGLPDGFLLFRSDHIFTESGLRPQYVSMPAQRVLEHIRSGARLCSPGWFSTPERRGYARYTLPIYRSRPLTVVTLRSNASRVRHSGSLRALLENRSLRIGLLEGYSEGHEVDEMVRETDPEAVRLTGSEGQRLRMLALGRVDYILLAPEELESLAQAENLDPKLFERIDMPDIPPGNLRYIICGNGVSPELIQRLNETILRVYEEIR
ncbi:MAG: substrate-binding periplasmic protein [Desulfovibrio sp.]